MNLSSHSTGLFQWFFIAFSWTCGLSETVYLCEAENSLLSVRDMIQKNIWIQISMWRFVRTSRWRPVLTGYVFWKVWDRMGTARWCCGWHCYLTKILRQQFLCTLSVLVWVISGYSSFIPQSEVMHVLGYLSGSELTISMTVRVNGYLSLSYPCDDVNLSSQLYL